MSKTPRPYKRKYPNPLDRLAAMRKPKTEEHKKKLSEAQQRYWRELREAKERAEREAKEHETIPTQ